MKYRTIVVDPPWDYPEGFVGHNRTAGKWSRRVEKALQYPAMTREQLTALPISGFAQGGANLFCWTTQKYLPHALTITSAWGFRYRQTLIWHKSAVSPLGGSVAPNDVEFLLVCRKGSCRLTGRLASCVIPAPQQKVHSRKPDVFLDLIEQLSPGPYLELFARRQRLGWDTWGNEALEHVSLDGADNCEGVGGIGLP